MRRCRARCRALANALRVRVLALLAGNPVRHAQEEVQGCAALALRVMQAEVHARANTARPIPCTRSSRRSPHAAAGSRTRKRSSARDQNRWCNCTLDTVAVDRGALGPPPMRVHAYSSQNGSCDQTSAMAPRSSQPVRTGDAHHSHVRTPSSAIKTTSDPLAEDAASPRARVLRWKAFAAVIAQSTSSSGGPSVRRCGEDDRQSQRECSNARCGAHHPNRWQQS